MATRCLPHYQRIVTKTIGDTVTYVEPEAPVETLDDTLADVGVLPVGDKLNKVEAERLVHTKAGTPDELRD